MTIERKVADGDREAKVEVAVVHFDFDSFSSLYVRRLSFLFYFSFFSTLLFSHLLLFSSFISFLTLCLSLSFYYCNGVSLVTLTSVCVRISVALPTLRVVGRSRRSV